MTDPEQNQPITEDQVQALLRSPELQADAARDFAMAHLHAFEGECRQVLAWQRTEGRAAVLAGAEPEAVREQTDARIGEARTRLHGKLVSLLAWARGQVSNDG